MFGLGKGKAGSHISGFIGKGVNFTGKLSFEGVVRIDGKFDGEIDAAGTLIVGPNAVIKANIKVDKALVAGEVRGLIEAASKVDLVSPGKVYCDIKTSHFTIGDGTLFYGKCEMPEEASPALPPNG